MAGILPSIYVYLIIFYSADAGLCCAWQVFKPAYGLFRSHVDYQQMWKLRALDSAPICGLLQVEGLVAGMVAVVGILAVRIFY